MTQRQVDGMFRSAPASAAGLLALVQTDHLEISAGGRGTGLRVDRGRKMDALLGDWMSPTASTGQTSTDQDSNRIASIVDAKWEAPRN